MQNKIKINKNNPNPQQQKGQKQITPPNAPTMRAALNQKKHPKYYCYDLQSCSTSINRCTLSKKKKDKHKPLGVPHRHYFSHISKSKARALTCPQSLQRILPEKQGDQVLGIRWWRLVLFRPVDFI